MSRTTYRDLCISALRTSKCVGLHEVPDQNEITYAMDELNGLCESLFLEGLFSPFDVTINVTTDSNGYVYFGETLDPLITVSSNKIPSSIEKVIDIDGYRELKYLNPNDYMIQFSNQLNTDIPFYTYDYDEPKLVKLQTSSYVKNIQVKYKPIWTAVALDDIFNLPQHYWGVMQYGLATLLADFFGKEDVQSLNQIYLSRKDRIESMNFEPNILGASRTNDNFYNGYGM